MQLQALEERWRARRDVLDGWGFGRRLKSEGVMVLLTGEPGTGKTEAASVLSSALGLQLYQVSTPALISKYVGETEKNIDAVLQAVEGRSERAALMFDEGESLFAKRVEVKGSGELAHNSQVGLLLSRLERLSGLVFLTTNNAAQIDPAFKRRFHVFIEFTIPPPALRAKILKLALADAPLADDLNLEVLRDQAFAPGNIQNIALNAAFIAKRNRSEVITNEHLYEAIDQEAHKMGRLHRSLR
jgi:SpoVK/Ycf46/Vps4 family AAA+-type ATPase